MLQKKRTFILFLIVALLILPGCSSNEKEEIELPSLRALEAKQVLYHGFNNHPRGKYGEDAILNVFPINSKFGEYPYPDKFYHECHIEGEKLIITIRPEEQKNMKERRLLLVDYIKDVLIGYEDVYEISYIDYFDIADISDDFAEYEGYNYDAQLRYAAVNGISTITLTTHSEEQYKDLLKKALEIYEENHIAIKIQYEYIDPNAPMTYNPE